MSGPLTNRTSWLEPAVAALLFGLSATLTLTTGRHPAFLLLDLVVAVGSALVPQRPVLGVGLTTVGGLGLMLAGEQASSTVMAIAPLLCIFALIRTPSRRSVPLSLLAGAFGYLLLVFAPSTNNVEFLANSVIFAVLLAIAIGGAHLWNMAIGMVHRERQFSAERLTAMRLELARDLHDTVAQTLSHAAMRAHLTMDEPGVPASTRAQLVAIADECGASAQDLRQLLAILRERDHTTDTATNTVSDATALRQELERQAARLRDDGLIPEISLDVDYVSPARAATLAKITVEAASNMVKHAPKGSTVRLGINQVGQDLIAVYENSLRESAHGGRRGYGLVGIGERAALLNGRSEVDTDLALAGVFVQPLGRRRDEAPRPRDVPQSALSRTPPWPSHRRLRGADRLGPVRGTRHEPGSRKHRRLLCLSSQDGVRRKPAQLARIPPHSGHIQCIAQQ